MKKDEKREIIKKSRVSDNLISRKDFLIKSMKTAGMMAVIPGAMKPLLQASNSRTTGVSEEARNKVRDLISKMTLKEKVSQLAYDAPAIDRLNVQKYNWWNECLHGVARAGLATVFPQAIGMAATWNAPLMKQVADVISDEARAKHKAFVEAGRRDIYMGLTFWTPNINIVRDPRWGRGQETYGEDPHLTGQMAVSFIEGLQGDDPNEYKVVATAKHFAVYNGPEPIRHKVNVQVSDQDLWETYLPAFEACVKEAKVESIMCAYNSLRGMPCCGNNPLLESILRDKWHFNGYVVSDCWAITDIFNKDAHHTVETPEEAAAMGIKSGTDLNCGVSYGHLDKSVEQGLVDEEEIDTALERLFTARYKLGMFEGEKQGKYMNIPYSVVGSEDHHQVALQMARESIVLLKNDKTGSGKPALPLSKDLDSVAVIGPNADNFWTMLANYHGTPPHYTTPLDGIRNKLKGRADVHYAPGCRIADKVPHLTAVESQYLKPSQGSGNGLYGEYFDNEDFKGKPAITRVDSYIDFIWKDDTPINGKMADKFSVRWTGTLEAPNTGTYTIGFNGMNGYRLYLNGELKFKNVLEHEPWKKTVEMDLQSGETVDIKIEFFNLGADPQAHLIWEIPNQDLMAEAKQAVNQSDAVVLCLGLNSHLEGEEMNLQVEGFKGGDRTSLDLPNSQIELMKEIVSMGKPVAMVLMSGSAVSIPWADENVPGIIQAWYGGQAGGTAIADVLFGDYNPGGRLPVTFYKSVDDLPDFTDYSMKDRTYKYFEGEPLYPFGYGLSYTQFDYSGFKVPAHPATSESMDVSVIVSNRGDRDGDEVVQLYLKHLNVDGQNPKHTLVGFKRIHLKAGESQNVSFTLNSDKLTRVDAMGNRVPPQGRVKLTVGGKQPGFSGSADAETTGVVDQVVTFS